MMASQGFEAAKTPCLLSITVASLLNLMAGE
jgi:hypothetical protein